jgi:hypothetical protein
MWTHTKRSTLLSRLLASALAVALSGVAGAVGSGPIAGPVGPTLFVGIATPGSQDALQTTDCYDAMTDNAFRLRVFGRAEDRIVLRALHFDPLRGDVTVEVAASGLPGEAQLDATQRSTCVQAWIDGRGVSVPTPFVVELTQDA